MTAQNLIDYCYQVFNVKFPLYGKYTKSNGKFPEGEYIRFSRPATYDNANTYNRLHAFSTLYKPDRTNPIRDGSLGYAEYFSTVTGESAIINIEDIEEVTKGEIYDGD